MSHTQSTSMYQNHHPTSPTATATYSPGYGSSIPHTNATLQFPSPTSAAGLPPALPATAHASPAGLAESSGSASPSPTSVSHQWGTSHSHHPYGEPRYHPMPPSTGLDAEERERRRRISHSAMERRRRERTNHIINELKFLVPWLRNEARMQKLEVLENAVQYIHQLQAAAAVAGASVSSGNIATASSQTVSRDIPVSPTNIAVAVTATEAAVTTTTTTTATTTANASQGTTPSVVSPPRVQTDSHHVVNYYQHSPQAPPPHSIQQLHSNSQPHQRQRQHETATVLNSQAYPRINTNGSINTTTTTTNTNNILTVQPPSQLSRQQKPLYTQESRRNITLPPSPSSSVNTSLASYSLSSSSSSSSSHHHQQSPSPKTNHLPPSPPRLGVCEEIKPKGGMGLEFLIG